MTAARVFHQPETLGDAWDLLKAGPASARAAWHGARPTPFDLETDVATVDLARLGLSGIEVEGDRNRLILGSMTPLSDVLRAPPVASLFSGILRRALRKTAHYGLRNLATVGGALEDPAGAPEWVTALLAVGAVARRYNGAESELDLAEFLHLPPGDKGLLLGVELDLEAGSSTSSAIQWVVRSPMDRALVVSAVCLDPQQEAVGSIRVALAGDGLLPTRAEQLETHLKGQVLKSLNFGMVREGLAGSLAIADSFRVPADYQEAMSVTLTYRALQQAAGLEVSDEG